MYVEGPVPFAGPYRFNASVVGRMANGLRVSLNYLILGVRRMIKPVKGRIVGRRWTVEHGTRAPAHPRQDPRPEATPCGRDDLEDLQLGGGARSAG